jgi:hypothetical protein
LWAELIASLFILTQADHGEIACLSRWARDAAISFMADQAGDFMLVDADARHAFDHGATLPVRPVIEELSAEPNARSS